jgi:hypothetical protein
MQAPLGESGGVFRREWLAHRYGWAGEGVITLPSGPPARWQSLRRFMTVDLALSTKSSADYSVIGVFGNGRRLDRWSLDAAYVDGV